MSREINTYYVEMKLMFEGEVEAESQEEAEDMVTDWDYYAGQYDGETRVVGETKYLCEDCNMDVEPDEDYCECCKEGQE